jgi:hypothetical protein
MLVSDITNAEKRNFENLLGMGSGYVLNFSNRTFEEFLFDATGNNIYDAKYDNGSGSKAQRLRAFWQVESNYSVAKLLNDLLEYAVELGVDPSLQQCVENCRKTVERLSRVVPVPEIGAITPNSEEKDFNLLAKSIRESIERNEPEAGLDRLHTFVTKYLRALCDRKGINTDKDKPLHSLLGEYIKHLKQDGYIESEMTERILKMNISILEAFNKVRNDQSFAHDNKLLNYDESLLVFNHVANAIKFLEAVERRNLTV